MEKLWNRDYWKCMISNFALFFAFYLLAPLLPLYLNEHFGATKDVIGIVLSAYSVTALVSRPISGYFVDSFSRKTVLLVFYFLFVILFVGYIAASTLLLFALFRMLHGGAHGAATVANSTIAIDVLPASRRNEGMGYYGLSNNLGMAIAPSVGLSIYNYTSDFEILFWLSLLIAGFGMAVNMTLKLPQGSNLPKNRKLTLGKLFLRNGWMLALNTVFFGFCYGVLSHYLAIYSKEVMGIAGGTGTFFLFLACGLMASRVMGASDLRRGRLARMAAVGAVLALSGYVLFVAVPNWIGYYGAAILIGLGNGHLWPALLNMIITLAKPSERGTANSTLLISWDTGMGLGILLGGVMCEHIGYMAAFSIVAAINMAGTALYFLCTRFFYARKKRLA